MLLLILHYSLKDNLKLYMSVTMLFSNESIRFNICLDRCKRWQSRTSFRKLLTNRRKECIEHVRVVSNTNTYRRAVHCEACTAAKELKFYRYQILWRLISERTTTTVTLNECGYWWSTKPKNNFTLQG